MLTISIEASTQNKLQQFAQVSNQSIDEIINLAVEQYLEHLSKKQLEAEIQAFEHKHPQLKSQYLGHYIAMHQGQVVDTDADYEALFLRIQEQFGDLTVLIRQVTETPAETYHFHGLRMEQERL